MAIINARMRQKRGPIAQLDKDKLLPGEFAIPEDSDKIYICIKTGVILEIPSTQSIQGVIDTLNAVVTQGTQMIDDFRQLEIDKVGIDDNNVSTMTTYSSEKITKLINEADSAENTVTFESNDSEENATWTDVPVLSSTEKHKSIFSKISTMFKNVRYLYKILGTTDISSIEDGTLTGAVAKLNSNLSGLTFKLITVEAQRDSTYTNLIQFYIGKVKGKKIFVTPSNGTILPSAISHINVYDDVVQIIFFSNLTAETNYCLDLLIVGA